MSTVTARGRHAGPSEPRRSLLAAVFRRKAAPEPRGAHPYPPPDAATALAEFRASAVPADPQTLADALDGLRALPGDAPFGGASTAGQPPTALPHHPQGGDLARVAERPLTEPMAVKVTGQPTAPWWQKAGFVLTADPGEAAGRRRVLNALNDSADGPEPRPAPEDQPETMLFTPDCALEGERVRPYAPQAEPPLEAWLRALREDAPPLDTLLAGTPCFSRVARAGDGEAAEIFLGYEEDGRPHYLTAGREYVDALARALVQGWDALVYGSSGQAAEAGETGADEAPEPARTPEADTGETAPEGGEAA